MAKVVPLDVVPVSAFKDNYVWTLRNATHAAVVDPGEARPVLDYLALDIPGHTRAHIAYYGAGSLFCGDTLFACGCGRVFEGTPQQMYASLEKLRALPDETKVYCGHEYTLANIGFAKGVEPGNAALAARETRDRQLREAGKPTLPSRLGEEKATNPFLRCTEPAVVESVNKYLGTRVSDPVRVFAAIREWKNRS
jgi:hydroxyacylglutathione hydrolase